MRKTNHQYYNVVIASGLLSAIVITVTAGAQSALCGKSSFRTATGMTGFIVSQQPPNTAISPEAREIWKGNEAYDQKNFTESLRCYQRSLQYNLVPDTKNYVLFRCGDIERKLGNLDAAKKDFEQLGEQDAEAKICLAEIDYALKNYLAVIDETEHLSFDEHIYNRKDLISRKCLIRAKALYKIGKSSEAKSEFKSLETVDLNDPEAREMQLHL